VAYQASRPLRRRRRRPQMPTEPGWLRSCRALVPSGSPRWIWPSWPLRRIFSHKKAAEFYFGVHGFGLDWPDEAFTTGSGGVLDAQVSRGQSVLDLSEHHGDGSPGMVALRAGQVMDVLEGSPIARDHPNMRPGIEALRALRMKERSSTRYRPRFSEPAAGQQPVMARPVHRRRSRRNLPAGARRALRPRGDPSCQPPSGAGCLVGRVSRSAAGW